MLIFPLILLLIDFHYFQPVFLKYLFWLFLLFLPFLLLPLHLILLLIFHYLRIKVAIVTPAKIKSTTIATTNEISVIPLFSLDFDICYLLSNFLLSMKLNYIIFSIIYHNIVNVNTKLVLPRVISSIITKL